MLKTQTVVEKLLVSKVSEFVLVLHFDLDHFALFDILETDAVFGQIDVLDAVVVLQILRQDEEIFGVQVVVFEVEFDDVVSFDILKRHVSLSIDG